MNGEREESRTASPGGAALKGAGSLGAPVSLPRRVLFLFSALCAVAATGLWLWDEARPEWARYFLAAQERLAEAGGPGATASLPTLVPQIQERDLGVVDRCTACHAGVGRPELAGEPEPLRPHPGPMAELHDVDKMGCTPCHDGQGRATRTPDAHGEMMHWEARLLRGALVQASCARCHARHKTPRAPALRRGAELMERHACFGCHVMPGAGRRGEVGPELTFAADRAFPGWLFAWLKSPARLLRAPRMADFSLSDGDAADIVAYLETFKGKAALSDPGFPPESASDDELDALYEKGAAVYRVSRCVSCHAVNGRGGTIGPDHARLGDKLSLAAISAWIENPGRFHPGTRMPRFRLTEKDRLALSYYLSEEMKDFDAEKLMKDRTKQPAPERGRKRMLALGCLGCHRVEGQSQAQPVGPDLTLFGEKVLDRLPFPADWEGPRTRVDWTRAKLREPRRGSSALIMPKNDLGADDLEALLVATLSLTRRAPEEWWADARLEKSAPAYPPGPVGTLMRDMRCLTCHTLDGTGAEVAPDLSWEGSRVRLDWLKDFLREPYEIRPMLVERMPRFYLAQDEIETIAGFLHLARVRDGMPAAAGTPAPPGAPATPASPDVVRGTALYGMLRCAGCHILGETGGAVGPNLSDVGRRLETSWMMLQLSDPAAVAAVEPRVIESEDQARDLAAFLATQVLPAAPAQAIMTQETSAQEALR